MSTHKALKLVARIWSLLSTGFILLFVFGELFNKNNTAFAIIKQKEIIGLLLFPVGLVTGFAISWRKEIPGSLVSIISMIVFIALIGVNSIIIMLSLPALIFLLQGILLKKKDKNFK